VFLFAIIAGFEFMDLPVAGGRAHLGADVAAAHLGACMTLLKRIGVGVIVSLAFMSHAAASFAQEPQAKNEAGVGNAFVKPKWSNRSIAFEMRGKPWATVFEWFSDQSGMPFSSQYPPPTGTFTFINPKDPKLGKSREYTLAEIYDIINELLQAQHKHTLIRLDSTLTMIPADVELKGSWFRRISLDELIECARTEIAEIVVKIGGGLNAEEFAPDVKRMLGDIGRVTPLVHTNQLILRADVASLRRVLPSILPDERDADRGNLHTFSHKCIYIRASTTEAVLAKSLGTAKQVVKLTTTPMLGSANDDPRGARGPIPAAPTRELIVRPHTVTSDDATNTVFITGPVDKIETAKTILAKLDVRRFKEDQGILTGPPTLKNHEVKSGHPDAMVKIMSEVFKNNSQVRISAAPPNKLLVYADPQTHVEISDLLNAEASAEPQSAVIGLNWLDAPHFIAELKMMFPDSKNNSPYLSADADSNSIRVRGTANQIKEVRLILNTMDDVRAFGGNRRLINLEKNSATTVAEALEMLLPQMRDNPIRVVLPGRMGSPPPKSEQLPVPKAP